MLHSVGINVYIKDNSAEMKLLRHPIDNERFRSFARKLTFAELPNKKKIRKQYCSRYPVRNCVVTFPGIEEDFRYLLFDGFYYIYYSLENNINHRNP